MDTLNIEGVLLNPAKVIDVEGGNVLTYLHSTDKGYVGFGEVYMSTVNPQTIKGWRRHNRVTLNFVVPVGSIRFVLFDDREASTTKGAYFDIVLSRDNYQRLTVPPGIWFAFKGEGAGENMLLNTIDQENDPTESDRMPLDQIQYNGW